MKSSRQQIKFLMEKTQNAANWDMDNDSDLKGGSGKYLMHSRFYFCIFTALILHFHEFKLCCF